MLDGEPVSGRIVAGYVAALVITGAHLLVLPLLGFPLVNVVGWPLFGLLCAAAMGYGVHRYRPVRRVPWYLLAGAIASGSIADTLYAVDNGANGLARTLSDLFYLAMVPPVAVGLILLTGTSV